MRATSILVFALSAIAATATTVLPRGDSGSCTTGTTQCCSTTSSVDAQEASEILGALSFLGLPLNIGAILGAAGTSIGVSCSPVSAGGVGGNSCTSQPVCCTGNYNNGVLATGCIPINVNP